MSSRPGRKVQSWDIPAGHTMKALLSYLWLKYKEWGLRGARRKAAVMGDFERMLPFHQEYWEEPRSVASIYGRAFTLNAKTKQNEDPTTNEKTKPYALFALRVMRLNRTWTREEFDVEVEKCTPDGDLLL